MNPWRHRLAGLALAALIGWGDQALKSYLLWGLQIRQHVIDLLPFFRLNYSENYGISLGLLSATSFEMRWVLVALTSVIAVGVFVWIVRERRLGDILALGLVLGGAIGNIRDRFSRGYVVDYADLHFGEFRPFLIFNLADAAITIGVIVLLVRSLLQGSDGTGWSNLRVWLTERGLAWVLGGRKQAIKDRIDGYSPPCPKTPTPSRKQAIKDRIDG